ncbi:MAG: hypothetical protein K8I03_13315 [Ignavibacteria bacterium]|nr:hypothetical protein [Ignavibacteria bacterium]
MNSAEKAFAISQVLQGPDIKLAMLVSTYENYSGYRMLLQENLDNFSTFELPSLMDSLRDEFEVIKMKLEHNTIALRTGGKISMLTFRNVIFSSIRLSEIEWTESFIEKYLHMVNEDSREIVYNHARGILCYTRKDYEAAIAHLSKVDLSNPYLISDTKTHLAIIFFEQGSTNPVILYWIPSDIF